MSASVGASERPIPRLRPPGHPAGGSTADEIAPAEPAPGGRAEARIVLLAGEGESFPHLLEARLRRAHARKGLRTRAALRVAAARLIHERGYERLRAAEIAATAALSKAAFYVYFRDKRHVAASVLRPFLAYAFPWAGAGSLEQAGVEAALNRLLPLVREHRHLLRAIEGLGCDDPRFAAAAQARILGWHRCLLSGAGRDPQLAPLFAATSLGFAWAPIAGGPTITATRAMSEQISRLWGTAISGNAARLRRL